jgi:hypothetical protein
MSLVLPALVWIAVGLPPEALPEQPPESPQSFLWPDPSGVEWQCGEIPEAYDLKDGDLVFYYHRWFYLHYHIGFRLLASGPPFHSGIVIRRYDGQLALLEAKPYNDNYVHLLEVQPRLSAFSSELGEVWVRRLREPLTPEQAERLTVFAEEQNGKRFALFRLALEMTPFGAHGPIRSRIWGSTRYDRPTWFCSELVAAAVITTGLLPPGKICPNTLYPRDLFRDNPHCLLKNWEPPLLWTPEPCLPSTRSH